ncbi:hypothetical protein OAW57_01445 [Flavobacteriales bacterium]|nr:hypothetical protein [Flavobacteriales bacterium]
MKQFSFLLLLVCSLVASAQSPQGISYQAVATDVQGAPLDNQAIVVRFSILEAAPTGAAVYIETHNTSTDPYGMFNLNLGMGIHVGGAAISLGEVNWGLAVHFLKVELDIEGDGGFVSMGTQQMMSVPYALYAEQAGNAGDDQDQDPTNELQTLSLSGDTISLSDGGSVVIPTTPAGDNQYNGGIYIECVDMGVSPLCGALGLSPNATLGPESNGYLYALGASHYLDADNFISLPHWRKFQFHGLPPGVASIFVEYSYLYNSGSYTEYYQPRLSQIELEFDEAGNAFVYFLPALNGVAACVSDGLDIVVPSENRLEVNTSAYAGGYSHLKFFYPSGNSLIDTNILIDF